MTNGFNINKIINAFNKYGWKIPVYIINWSVIRYKYKKIANRIEKLPDKYFVLKDVESYKKPLYIGDIQKDVEKILKGKRKILFYSSEKFRDLDIKYKWEENRMQYLYPVALNKKSLIAHKYLENELLEFSKKNFTDNTNAMEISISLINIIVAVQILGDEELKKKEYIMIILKKSLLYILRNIEVGLVYSNNHYFFDLLGLKWILEECDIKLFNNKMKKLVDRQFIRLLRQIISQDGSLYEGSIYYHKYITEAFLEFFYYHPGIMDAQYKNYVEKMISFLINMSIDNKIYGIGDNDSGRVLPLPQYFSYSSRDITTIKILAERLGVGNEKKGALIKYDDFGICVVRKKNFEIVIRCDEIKDKKKNKIIGGHYHNDQLSVLISILGKEIFIDPGTYLYIPLQRYRINNMITKVHNTVFIEGLEQNKLTNSWKYYERRSKGYIEKISEKEIISRLKYSNELQHKRNIYVTDTTIEITDEIFSPTMEKINGKVNFCLHPLMNIKIINKNRIEIYSDDFVLDIYTSNKIDVVESSYFPEYGLKNKCKRIQIPLQENKSHIIMNLIQTRKNKESS